MKSLAIFLAALLVSTAASGQTPTVKVVEFHSATMNHYFLTPHVPEQDALDRGVIKGWQRTGYSFLAHVAGLPSTSGVCRFYYTNYVVDSHFYTANPAECEKLIREKIWQLEETGFYVRTPDAFGQCPAATQAIERLYNNGQGGAPNHRYLSDAALIREMLDRGWILEGTVFCAPLEGSSSSPTPVPEPEPPRLPPAADPTNSLGIYCPGATGTRIVRVDWPAPGTYERVATDSLEGEAMVFVLDVPFGVDPDRIHRLIGIYYQSRARPLRRASLSATPCDFSASLGPVSFVEESTQFFFSFKVGIGSAYVIGLEAGKRYYINIQNLSCGSDENCRFVVDLYP